ncbi:MAG: mechanosensitive ion channel family protein [Planctomycetales bacterium]|nr:mechanosensitive ion channel family protein [Planctomycetales bacterium]
MTTWLLTCAVALGQDGSKQPEMPQATAAELNRMGSARLTMKTFLEGNLEQQTACLDLSNMGFTADSREIKGAELAYELQQTINRILEVSLIEIPNEPDGSPYGLDGQSHRIDRGIAGEVRETAVRHLQQMVLERQESGVWLFSAATVEAIPTMAAFWEQFEPVVTEPTGDSFKPFSLWLRDQFPSYLRGDAEASANRAFYVAPYQWISMLVVIALGFLADRVVRGVLNFLMGIWLHLRKNEETGTRQKMFRPIGLVIQGGVWFYGIKWLSLPPVLLDTLVIGLKGFTIIAVVWTSFHLISLLAHVAQRRAALTATRYDDIIVPMVARSLRFLAVCIGVITFAQVFKLPVMGLVGGLGLGGMAIAFAAQDAVSNFFGSLTVLLDRPFEIGDWVVTDSVEGTVETVGFRSTRIRTFYNSVVTLPNSQLTTAAVDNMGRRKYRRLSTKIGVEYSTSPEQIEAFCEGIRELIRRHPYTRKDYYHVYFNAFDDSSLTILLYCFFECPDWSVELRERQRLLLDIMRLARQLDIEFAFPTRTVHLRSSAPDAPERAGDRPLGQHADAVNEALGRDLAARIAGPLLGADERPGSVRFTE